LAPGPRFAGFVIRDEVLKEVLVDEGAHRQGSDLGSRLGDGHSRTRFRDALLLRSRSDADGRVERSLFL